MRFARGKLKSESRRSIMQWFRSELARGKKEFWVTSQDCACYGLDRGDDINGLLEEMLGEKGEFRIRIGMMNPGRLKALLPKMLGLMEDKRLYRFLHIPIQSGNNRVLGLMKREYSVEEWLGIAGDARARFPEITVMTDIICGFPTETRSEFSDTLWALEKAGVDAVNISKYGKRPGTLAVKLGDTPGPEKKRRSKEARVLCQGLALERAKKMLGKECIVLVTENGKQGPAGRTGNYKPCAVAGEIGGFVRARIVGAKPTHLEGKITKGETNAMETRGTERRGGKARKTQSGSPGFLNSFQR